MATVEGVARRIDPDCDIWAAADPVVCRWVAREAGPAARVRDLTEDIVKAIQGLARLAEAPPPPPPATSERADDDRMTWFAIGAAVAGGAFLLVMALG